MSAIAKFVVLKSPDGIIKRRSFSKKQRLLVFEKTNGICCIEGCGKPAEDIDHEIPLALGGTHDESNWQPMCKTHHKIKTAQDVKDIARAKRRQRYHLEGRGRKRKGRKMVSRNSWPKRTFQKKRSAQTVFNEEK